MSGRKQLVELNDKIDCLPAEEISTNIQMQMVDDGQFTHEPKIDLEVPELKEIVELNED